MNDETDWSADDPTWKLLGEAEPRRDSCRFADDAVRAVKLLPESDPWWTTSFSFHQWGAAAACGALAAAMFLNSPKDSAEEPGTSLSMNPGEKWMEISEVAEAEMLAAAAEDLDSFTDQELVSLIGF